MALNASTRSQVSFAATPARATRGHSTTARPTPQLVKQLLYEQSSRQEVENANKIEPAAGEASHPKTSSRPVTPAEQRASQPEHLTETGAKRKAHPGCSANRHFHRDAAMLLVAYRHGLRASEICDLRWDKIDFTSATLHVHRVKNGKPSTHPVRGDELRALRKLHREAPKSPFVFMTERGGPFTTDSFNWLVAPGQKAVFRSKFMHIC
jgi:integrase